MTNDVTGDTTLDNRIQTVFRRGAWFAAIVAIVVGAFGLIFPVAALHSVALLLGVYLIVAGVGRVFTAITARTSAARWRWLIGIVGLLVAAAGVLCLIDPFGSLFGVALIVGIGWMLDGVICVAAAFGLFTKGTRTALVVTGIVSFLLGITVLLLPGAAILTFLFITAIFLVVIGVIGIVGLIVSGARIRQARR